MNGIKNGKKIKVWKIKHLKHLLKITTKLLYQPIEYISLSSKLSKKCTRRHCFVQEGVERVILFLELKVFVDKT